MLKHKCCVILKDGTSTYDVAKFESMVEKVQNVKVVERSIYSTKIRYLVISIPNDTAYEIMSWLAGFDIVRSVEVNAGKHEMINL